MVCQPNRNIQDANGYRYAYQGQEKDPETGKEAFELRLWDGRIGRWLTTDPAGQYHSPYLGMGNNPISRIDPDGGSDCPSPCIYTGDWQPESGFIGPMPLNDDPTFNIGTVVVTGSNGSNAARRQRIHNVLNFIDIPELLNFEPIIPGNGQVYGKGKGGIYYEQDSNPDDKGSPWIVDVSQMIDVSPEGLSLMKFRFKKGHWDYNAPKHYTVKLVKFVPDADAEMAKLAPIIYPPPPDSIFKINSIWCCTEKGHHSIKKGLTRKQVDSTLNRELDTKHIVTFEGLRY